MSTRRIAATAHADGNRIELSWEGPPSSGDIAVIRRERTYPTPQDAGSPLEIYRGPDRGGLTDVNVEALTVYYYGLIDLSDPSAEMLVAHAMPTGSYGSGATLYKLLPAVYQRLDTLTAPAGDERLSPADRAKGQLQRLLEMVGGQYDVLRSFAAGMKNFADPQRIEGSLLPLLARWIGWKTDFTRPLYQQRSALTFGPSLYRTTGTAANLRATVNRLNTWDVRIKEFIHSIAMSNEPERLALYQVSDNPANQPALVSRDFAFEGRPSLLGDGGDEAWLFYHARQSRPRPFDDRAPVLDAQSDEHCWRLFAKRRGHDVWHPSRAIAAAGGDQRHPCAVKRSPDGFRIFWTASSPLSDASRIAQCVLSLGADAQPAYVRGTPIASITLADGDAVTVTVDGKAPRTVVIHAGDVPDLGHCTAAQVAAVLDRELPGAVVNVNDRGAVCITSLSTGAGASLHVAPSPLGAALGLVTAVAATGRNATRAQLTGAQSVAGAFPGVTAESCVRIWIDHRRAIAPAFGANPAAQEVVSAINNLMPGIAALDAGGRLVITSPTFGDASRVQVDVADDCSASGPLGFGVPLPDDGTHDDTEPTAAVDATGHTWLFWSSRIDNRWTVCCRAGDNHAWTPRCTCSDGASPAREPHATYDAVTSRLHVVWSRHGDSGVWDVRHAVAIAPDPGTPAAIAWTYANPLPSPASCNRREPVALARPDGSLVLHYAADRIDGWHVWRWEIGGGGAEAQVTHGQFTHRGPAAAMVDGRIALLCRANATIRHASKVYPGAETLDSRCSGTTALSLANAARLGSVKAVDDITHYTHDFERSNADWYACNVVGVYLLPDSTDEQFLTRSREVIRTVLKTFLPIQVRPVFIINPAPVDEPVYAYDVPLAAEPRFIGESYADVLTIPVPEEVPEAIDAHIDSVPQWTWIRAWSAAYRDHLTVDSADLPVSTRFRTWHSGLEAGT